MNTVSTIISDMLSGIDKTGGNFVEVLYKRIGLYLDPTFFSMLVLYVVWWGYSIISGKSTASPLEAAERLAKAACVYWLVTNWGPFAETLYVLVQNIPDALSTRIVATISATSGSSTTVSGIPAMFDALYETALKVSGQIYSGTMMDVFGALLSLIIIVFVTLFIGVALAAIIAAKVMLYIVLALGPVWIIMYLFEYSSRYTNGFLSITANLVVQQILIYGFLGFYFYLVKVSVGAANSGASVDITGKLAQVMPLLVVTLVGFYVLLQIPMIAGTITGAHGLNTVSAWRGMQGTVMGATSLSNKVFNIGAKSMRQSTAGRNQFAADAAARNIQRETAKNGSAL